MLGGKDRFLLRSVLFFRLASASPGSTSARARGALLAGLAGLAGACSSPPVLQGAGVRCMQVADCQLGLVCVYQTDGTGTCSGDTSALVMTEGDGSAAQAATTPPAGDAGAPVLTGTDDAATGDEPPASD
ncbi:MAG TPA: hypothetical protein VGM06_00430 [Polyangiaceae bacterium]